MATVKTQLSLEDVERLGLEGKSWELDEGELIAVSPNNARHALTAMKIAAALSRYCDENANWRTVGSDLGCVLHRGPDIVVAPDAALIAAGRLKDLDRFFEGAPELVVEVPSPSDTAARVRRKTRQYLKYGVKEVWLVYAEAGEIEVFRPDGSQRTWFSHETLETPLLSGFNLPVASIFEF